MLKLNALGYGAPDTDLETSWKWSLDRGANKRRGMSSAPARGLKRFTCQPDRNAQQHQVLQEKLSG